MKTSSVVVESLAEVLAIVLLVVLFVVLSVVVGCERASNPLQMASKVSEEPKVPDGSDPDLVKPSDPDAEMPEVPDTGEEPTEPAQEMPEVPGAGEGPTEPAQEMPEVPDAPVSDSYEVVVGADALRVYRIDIAGRPIVATIDQSGVSSTALYETPLAVPGYPIALLAVGVPGADDGTGVAYVFLVTTEGAHLQEEIIPFHPATVGLGSFVQFEHVDDAGWWLNIESTDGESLSAPIGRWF